MTLHTIIVLSIGTCAMLIPMLLLMKQYRINLWKGFPASIILTVTGTIGTYIWFFLESSWFGGRSYYGAVFLVPLSFKYVAKYLHIPYGELMDFCAPAECVMLAIMKYQCFIDGCCNGRIINVAADGSLIVFPSQMVELVNALILMVVLMCMVFSKKNRGKIYPWYLILYGTTRFALNWFREDTTPLLMGLPAGNLWSVLAVFIGILWLYDYKIVIVKNEKSQN